MTLNKFTLAAIFVTCSVSFSLAVFAVDDAHLQPPFHNKTQVIKFNNNQQKVGVSINNAGQPKFIYDPTLDKTSKYTYIVEFNELPVAQEQNAIAELLSHKQQRHQISRQQTLLSTKMSRDPLYAVNKQIDAIERQQNAFLKQGLAPLLNIKVLANYKYAINGIAIRATQSQAQSLAQSTLVKRIHKDQKRKLYTDRGPVLVGAPKVWDGSAFGAIPQTAGEGVVIGILDSGVNTDHPSFAEVSGDGYVHSNPNGDGNYLGDCATNFSSLCNNKLIGVYSYTDITGDYADTSIFPPNLPRNGEDYGGHGSHVASIAAGNILRNVDEVYPAEGQERSSGTPTGFTFDQISGVAPRANIISYQVCYGGTAVMEDTYADCLDSAILKAIDDAIADNVDVINYSISGGGDPWQDPAELAFLSARNAGIFVAVSAGNSGPDVSTSEKAAPWYSSVAASEHGRENVFSKELKDFSGGASALSLIVGQSNSGSLTAPIVYAGDYSNPNDPGGDSAQCLEPFPQGTFAGQIVVCDRGEIARIQKAVNVRDGGAGGYVLANIDGGETFLANDQYVIPGIHINASDGNRLKAWLASGTDHRATITTGIPSQIVDASRVDTIADYSSRGPNTQISILAPTMTAPGSNIFAAYADEQLGHDGHEPAASDYTILDGTSMSSPHVAGAAALVKAVNPSWGPDQIRSALALSATTTMKKEDATTNADFFDMGSGRIQVDKAIASPLIMSETASNYSNANPSRSGDPRSLNLPSITDNACQGLCTWSRTFTATTDATFDVDIVSISEGLTIEASPQRFTLLEGQSQQVTFTINSFQASKQEYSFALVQITSPGLPELSLPIAVLSSIGNFPLDIQLDGRRNTDSVLITDIDAISIENFVLTAYQPVKSTVVATTITEDTGPNDYLDNLTDGVNITTVVVPEGAKRFVAEIKASSAPDLDLFVLYDADGDNVPSLTEEVARSRSGTSIEEIQINYPTPGTYFIAVQNFEGSRSGTDTFDMRYAVVEDQLAGDSLQAIAPSSLEAGNSFDMRLIYDLALANSGDDYFAAFGMGSTSGNDDLGLLNFDINRIDDDVVVTGTARRLKAGDIATVNIRVKHNPTNEERAYKIIQPLPVGTQFTDFSSTNNGEIINNEIVWFVDKAAGETSDTVLEFSIQALEGVPAGPIDIKVNSQLISQPFTSIESSDSFTKVQIEGSPVISLGGSNTTSASFNLTETQTLTIPLSIDEPNDDAVTVVFSQTEGPNTNVVEVNGEYVLVAPQVEADTQLRYDLSVTDSNGNSTSGSVTVNVLNNPSPIINAVDAPSNANGGAAITISVTASDPENEALTISINGQTISGTSATFTTPTIGASVSYTIVVSDGFTQAQQSVTVSLTQVTPPQSSSGGGSMSGIFLCAMLTIAIRRKIEGIK